MSDHGLLLFDGNCAFCNKAVMYTAKRDVDGYILYASLQSELGQYLLEKNGLPRDYIQSLVYFDKGKVYTRTDASCEIAKHFSGASKLLHYLKFIPAPLRNPVYDLFAKYRYKLFGRIESCELPNSEIASRVLAV